MEEEAYEDFVLDPKAQPTSTSVTEVLERIFVKIEERWLVSPVAIFCQGNMFIGLRNMQTGYVRTISTIGNDWSGLDVNSLLPFAESLTFKGGHPIVHPDRTVDYGKFGAVAGIRFFLHLGDGFITSGLLVRQREYRKAVWRVSFYFGESVVGSAADNFAQGALLKAAEETAIRCSGTMDLALETLKTMWWPR